MPPKAVAQGIDGVTRISYDTLADRGAPRLSTVRLTCWTSIALFVASSLGSGLKRDRSWPMVGTVAYSPARPRQDCKSRIEPPRSARELASDLDNTGNWESSGPTFASHSGVHGFARRARSNENGVLFHLPHLAARSSAGRAKVYRVMQFSALNCETSDMLALNQRFLRPSNVPVSPRGVRPRARISRRFSAAQHF